MITAAALIGLVAGAAAAYLLCSRAATALRDRAIAAETQLASERTHAEKTRNEFRLVAQEALDAMEQKFSASALRDFRQANTEAGAALGHTQQQIENSVTDMRARLEDYQHKVQRFEEERQTQHGKLEKSIEQVLNVEQSLRMETSSLKRALTDSSGVRGGYGERMLLELLEQSEFIRGIHFTTQESFEGEEAVARPDFIIHLPGGKHLAVDSKEVSGEYRLAQDTDDPVKQKEHYQRLVQNVRTNLIKLSRKECQDHVDKDIPFVVMFISHEGAIRAAFATDPQIFQDAVDKKVILASPMTIIPLIQLIRHSWQQQRLTENARELGSVVEELGNRLSKFVQHLQNVQSGLKKAADGWNQALGSWDSRVAPQIEKTKALGGKLKDAEPLLPIESGPREWAQDGAKCN